MMSDANTNKHVKDQQPQATPEVEELSLATYTNVV